MQFTETEVRFLRQENAMQRLRPIRDLRELGCPAHIFEAVLEDRARKLGGQWKRFRDEQQSLAAKPPQPDLDARIAAAKLF